MIAVDRTARTHLSLGDLLDVPEFGLRLVAGPPGALTRRVAGAHVVEAAEPSQWVPRDWLMLTTGLRVRDRPREQADLVAEIDDHGVAALGWATGAVAGDIPEAVRREAERRAFPVLGLPTHTPFRDVIRFVSETSQDADVLHRLERMQAYLIDALDQPDPEAAIVQRLGSLLDVSVLLFGADGRVVAGTGPVPEQPLWNALDRTADAPISGGVGAWRFLAEPVDSGGVVVRWLVCASSATVVDECLARPLMRHAMRALGLLWGVSRFEERRDRERRATMLRAIVEGSRDWPSLADDAEALGITAGRCELQVACCHAGGGEASSTAIARAVEAESRRRGVPWLLDADSSELLVVLQCDADVAAAALDRALRPLPRARAGLGSPAPRLRDVPRALAEARLAVATIDRAGQPVVHVDDLDAASWLLAATPPELSARKLGDLLRPLRERPVLLETLRCWFDCDMSTSRAACRLFLHPNSLRYRLAQIERLIGASLRAPQTIANLHLALLHHTAARTVGHACTPTQAAA